MLPNSARMSDRIAAGGKLALLQRAAAFDAALALDVEGGRLRWEPDRDSGGSVAGPEPDARGRGGRSGRCLVETGSEVQQIFSAPRSPAARDGDMSVTRPDRPGCGLNTGG